VLRRGVRVAWIPLAGILLMSCAAVDQFGTRINDTNLNSQNAMNRETLLNIVRAEYLQPLNFVAITQVTGGQTETLSTGLPTITFGPAQTMAQHQFVFASNSLSSGVTGGFQSNPLVSTAFQDGMLSPISPRNLALLVAAHNSLREPVSYAAIDSIRLTMLDLGGETVTYRNDPSDNFGGPAEGCDAYIAHAEGRTLAFPDTVCNFSRFKNFLGILFALGFTVDLVPPAAGASTAQSKAKPAAAGASDSTAQKANEAPGRFCFDSTLAAPEWKQGVVQRLRPFLCGAESTSKNKITLKAPFGSLGHVRIDIITLRSPIGIYSYFGKLLRTHTNDQITYYTGAAKELLGNEPFLNIVNGDIVGIGCFVSIAYDGHTYCVPQGSFHTAMMLDILWQLRNLAITPSDLNSAFSVRVINGGQ
jgi:hypothetical protein